jgi:hypothetical protein
VSSSACVATIYGLVAACRAFALVDGRRRRPCLAASSGCWARRTAGLRGRAAPCSYGYILVRSVDPRDRGGGEGLADASAGSLDGVPREQIVAVCSRSRSRFLDICRPLANSGRELSARRRDCNELSANGEQGCSISHRLHVHFDTRSALSQLCHSSRPLALVQWRILTPPVIHHNQLSIFDRGAITGTTVSSITSRGGAITRALDRLSGCRRARARPRPGGRRRPPLRSASERSPSRVCSRPLHH